MIESDRHKVQEAGNKALKFVLYEAMNKKTLAIFKRNFFENLEQLEGNFSFDIEWDYSNRSPKIEWTDLDKK